ncbi:MAG: hypothetical protein ACOVMP_03290 [Chthoniobacterales bacterium]
MRSVALFVSLGILLAASFGTLGAQTSAGQEKFTAAVRLFADGDTAAAKAQLAEALEADPKHRQAALLLQRIKMQERSGGDLEQRAAAVVIPSFDVKDASLSSVLDFLPTATAEASNGTVTLNTVRLFTPEFGNETRVTLSIRNAPVTEILRYVAEAAGLKIQYQPHAVVLSKPAD